MKWNVLYYNSNKRKIESYNIFKHGGFRREFCKIAQTCKNKEHFAEELWHCLMYYFWSKCEYEVLIYPWPCSIERDKPRKRYRAGEPRKKNYTLIFGHTPTDYYQKAIPLEIWYGTNCIGIDCGCAYPYGRLACLRLDDMCVFYSEDAEENLCC